MELPHTVKSDRLPGTAACFEITGGEKRASVQSVADLWDDSWVLWMYDIMKLKETSSGYWLYNLKCISFYLCHCLED